MQAITLRYHGPTNTLGSRISATAECGRVVTGWDYALGQTENYHAAALAFLTRWGWLEGRPGIKVYLGTLHNGDRVAVIALPHTKVS